MTADWIREQRKPTPVEWVDWFTGLSREAQEAEARRVISFQEVYRLSLDRPSRPPLLGPVADRLESWAGGAFPKRV